MFIYAYIIMCNHINVFISISSYIYFFYNSTFKLHTYIYMLLNCRFLVNFAQIFQMCTAIKALIRHPDPPCNYWSIYWSFFASSLTTVRVPCFMLIQRATLITSAHSGKTRGCCVPKG